MTRTKILLGLTAATLAACAGDPRFPLRAPLWHDSDLASVRARCHVESTRRDPRHVSCAPRVHASRTYRDGIDALVFRPISESLGVVVGGEAIDVNSFDEVPDSSWFTNRIGARPLAARDLVLGACTDDQVLDPDDAPDGSWVIDQGKLEGSTTGFRVVVPGKGKFMLKAETSPGDRERQSAASLVGAAIFHAAGYYASCEQIVWVRPAILKLTPGLRSKPNFGDEKPFDQKALDAIIADSPKRDGKIRLGASAWIGGHILGPDASEGTRADDPNDVVAHEDRRELRGMRVLAAWIDRYDTREGNTLDTWIADDPRRPDSSPGHVLHYQLDTSEALGGLWPWGPLARRLGDQYVLDWGGMAADFVTLGIPRRPWDEKARVPGRETFGYFTADLDPDAWRNAYPVPAYSRATERDKAWMARIVARFTPSDVDALAKAGEFADPSDAEYLSAVLRARQQRILERYLTRLSPITDVTLEGDRLCAVDLAERRGLRPPSVFRYDARAAEGDWFPVEREPGGRLCVTLHHGGARYLRVAIADGVARGVLVAHLYDLGAPGFRLVGLERPSP